MISSRTPEGYPLQCRICGAENWVTPDETLRDAPCPACGALAWPVGDDADAFRAWARRLPAAKRARVLELAANYKNADSLDAVETVMELEELFDVEIPDDVAMTFETPADFYRWLWTRGS